MAEIETTPTPLGAKKRGSFFQRNRLVVLGAGGVGLVYFLSKRGQAGSNVANAPLDGSASATGTVAQLVPVSASQQEPTDVTGSNWQDTLDSVLTSVQGEQQALQDALNAAGKGSIDIHGHKFVGGTGSQITGSGKDSTGQFTQYLIFFPGYTESWRYYAANNTWKQTHKSNSGPGHNHPGGGGGGGGGGGHHPPAHLPRYGPPPHSGGGHPGGGNKLAAATATATVPSAAASAATGTEYTGRTGADLRIKEQRANRADRQARRGAR